MRKFEFISETQWKKDICVEYKDFCEYIDAKMPCRGTKHSAGYDFTSPVKIVVPAHKMAKIPTGIKAQMNEDEVLSIYPRSSIGFKTGIRLANTVGIVDSDYYNNANNEGHIFIKFYNPTNEDYEIDIGDKIAQGIFTKYLIVDNEEEILTERAGGIGSTGR